MRIGVTVFPGSNCDRDALTAVERMDEEPVELWHADADLKGVDAVIVPGGFSYGDYLRPGAIARFAGVMGPLEEFANGGGPVLGVCNGFQVLTEAHLLPGALLQNMHMRFVCDRIRVRVETTGTTWTAGCEVGEELTLPVAHNEGNYYADEETLARLEDEGRVVLRYLDNPNGSVNDIAGVCNEGRNVVGIMPHPERVSDPVLGSDEGLRILRSVLVGAGGLNIQETYGALGISDFEYGRILELMGREPNFLELSLFSVMWSEHCGYKNSRPLLRRFPNEGPRVMQGPGENAGVVEVGDGWALAFKMESHNHPSAVEPYEGAATGVGGIIRDILAMGARPVALLDSLRFGPLEEERNRYLFREVVRGIGGYGNAVGVPTIGGEVEFSRAYSGNPLVNAMCVGLIRVDDLMRSQATGPGNAVVLLGSRTGRDGIHGATFASDELTEESESKRSNVQVGDPFAEKMLIECCLKLLEENLLVSLQDLGAAGITSSAAEMAASGAAGIDIEVEKVPRRESGMEPWEVMISESQERMLAVVEPDNVEAALALAERYGIGGTVIGHVADHGDLRVKENGETVGTVPADYLADAPVYAREVVRPKYLDEVQDFDAATLPEPEDYNEVLLKMLAHPNLRSRRSIYTQYDHQVGTDTVVLPGADAAVLRIKGTKRGFAVTADGRGRHCYLDPRGGGAATVAEAYRNLSCVGAEPVAVTDCLNFGSPEKPDGYYQLAECIEGMSEACEAFGTPVVSGNVSLYNETDRGPIYPTPTVGMVGVMDDVSRHATPGFKREEDMVVLIGPMPPVQAEMPVLQGDPLAGSDYLEVVHGKIQGLPIQPALAEEKRCADLVREMVRSKLVDTAHDVSGGGEAVALAEMAIAGGIGFDYEGEVDVQDELRRMRADAFLFEERSGMYLVAFPEERWDDVQNALEGFAYDWLGNTSGDRFKIGDLINLGLGDLKRAYEQDLFGIPGEAAGGAEAVG